MIPIIRTINLFESLFSTSFKHTSRILYNVTFDTSNVVITSKKLLELQRNFTSGVNTGKHVGLHITLDDITTVEQSLYSLMNEYKLFYGIQVIPSKLKLYDMIREIRGFVEKNENVDIAKDVLDRILTPEKSGKKLNKKELIKEQASIKSNERQIEMLKKQGKLKD